MKCFIPAAGRGTRLQPLTDDRPKPLIELNKKPIIWHIVNTFPDIIDEIIMVVGYKGEMLKEYCGSNFLGRKMTYVTQEKLGGTADALILAKEYLIQEPFLVHYSDDIVDDDSIIRCLKHDLSILVIENPDPRRFGVIVPKKNNLVDSIVEKPENPPSNLINTGVMKLDHRIFDYKPTLHSNGEYYLTTMFDYMVKEHETYYEIANRFISIAVPEDVPKAEKELNS